MPNNSNSTALVPNGMHSTVFYTLAPEMLNTVGLSVYSKPLISTVETPVDTFLYGVGVLNRQLKYNHSQQQVCFVFDKPVCCVDAVLVIKSWLIV